MNPRYALVLWWDEEDACFFAEVPDLPGCKTHGDTYEQAFARGMEAMASWIDTAREDGVALPTPSHPEARLAA